MMTRIRGQVIRGSRDQNTGSVFRNYEFDQCTFEHCLFGALRDPERRPTAKGISLTGCSAAKCLVRAPILDSVVVDELHSDGNLVIWAPALRHVTLTGFICDLVVNVDVDPAGPADPANEQFRLANEVFYRGVDWALDISRAEFSSVSIRGIPARLVRRDPESQVIIRRERVLSSRWHDIPLDGTHWATSIRWFIDRGEPDHILIAPKRSQALPRLVAGLRLLQREGVAEPD